MKKLSLLTLILVLTSCATTMPGKSVGLKSGFLSATLAENGDFSSENIKMYQVSVRNNTNDWIVVDSALISNAPTTQVLVGDKISSWLEACSLEKKVADYNTSLVLGVLAAGGMVAGATSNNSATSNIGFITSLGAITTAGVKDFIDSKKKADFQAAFPEGHILKGFTVPPMKVVQRWILIE
ncbi:MAG: hypothetical protein K2Q18_10040, partial [Bdellovibrionales bacterium]|nr:hypothetical protein [Bdellovibrionales bacterium]